jgi:hypothetical protein
MKRSETEDPRVAQFKNRLERVNQLTGLRWKLVFGNPRVSPQYRLSNGEEVLSESNMIWTLTEFLNGVEVGIKISKKGE